MCTKETNRHLRHLTVSGQQARRMQTHSHYNTTTTTIITLTVNFVHFCKITAECWTFKPVSVGYTIINRLQCLRGWRADGSRGPVFKYRSGRGFQLDWSSRHAMRLNSWTCIEVLPVSYINCDRQLRSGIRAPKTVMSTGGQITDSVRPYAPRQSL